MAEEGIKRLIQNHNTMNTATVLTIIGLGVGVVLLHELGGYIATSRDIRRMQRTGISRGEMQKYLDEQFQRRLKQYCTQNLSSVIFLLHSVPDRLKGKGSPVNLICWGLAGPKPSLKKDMVKGKQVNIPVPFDNYRILDISG